MKKLLVLLYLILASWSVRAQQDSVKGEFADLCAGNRDI